MERFFTRQFQGEPDLVAITQLMNDVDAVDQVEQGTTVDELRQMVATTIVDPLQDICVWERGGTLAGWAWLRIPRVNVDAGSVGFKVHPAARGNDLEEAMLAWSQERLLAASQEAGRTPIGPVKLRAWTHDRDTERMRLLEQHDFERVRTWLRMARSLEEPIPEPCFPSGFALGHLAGADEVAAWVELFNQSFIDHWNHHDLTTAEREQWIAEAHYRGERDLIAVAEEGTFAAFCFCSINPVENGRNKRNDGWISKLGTRRGYRNIGLGRAMVLAGLQRLRTDGAKTALLGVDADSPTGATRLYESVGFRPVFRSMTYERTLLHAATR